MYQTNFETNIINIHGNLGKKWLEDLPRAIRHVGNKYKLSSLTPLKNLTYNYVLSGFQNIQPIILKLGINGLKQEAMALKAFSGFGAIAVLAESDTMLLLKWVIPGNTLKSYFPSRDDDAVSIVCDIIKTLHTAPLPKSNIFPHIKDWLIVLDKKWNVPIHHLQKAREIRNNLLTTLSKPVLLHGDLHHDNILRNGEKFVIIDPKGVIGEVAYEIASFIRNPVVELLASENATNIINNRIKNFAAILKLPHQRIVDWCFVQTVLAWIWTVEDGCNQQQFQRLTEIFTRL